MYHVPASAARDKRNPSACLLGIPRIMCHRVPIVPRNTARQAKTCSTPKRHFVSSAATLEHISDVVGLMRYAVEVCSPEGGGGGGAWARGRQGRVNMCVSPVAVRTTVKHKRPLPKRVGESACSNREEPPWRPGSRFLIAGCLSRKGWSGCHQPHLNKPNSRIHLPHSSSLPHFARGITSSIKTDHSAASIWLGVLGIPPTFCSPLLTVLLHLSPPLCRNESTATLPKRSAKHREIRRATKIHATLLGYVRMYMYIHTRPQPPKHTALLPSAVSLHP